MLELKMCMSQDEDMEKKYDYEMKERVFSGREGIMGDGCAASL